MVIATIMIIIITLIRYHTVPLITKNGLKAHLARPQGLVVVSKAYQWIPMALWRPVLIMFQTCFGHVCFSLMLMCPVYHSALISRYLHSSSVPSLFPFVSLWMIMIMVNGSSDSDGDKDSKLH